MCGMGAGRTYIVRGDTLQDPGVENGTAALFRQKVWRFHWYSRKESDHCKVLNRTRLRARVTNVSRELRAGVRVSY